MTVGRASDDLPRARELESGWEDGQERIKVAEPLWRLRRNTVWNYAALVFFTAFAGGFALSLAANSCFTFAVMAFTSTL